MAGCGLAVLLALALAFPYRTLEARLSTVTDLDELAIAYLRVWLRAEPDDVALRLVLARQKMFDAQYRGALNELETVLRSPDPKLRRAALLMMAEINERIAFAAPEGSAEREAAMRQVATTLERIVALTTKLEDALPLIPRALAVGSNALALRIYEQLWNTTRSLPAAQCREAARLALAQGDYEAAAQWHLRARSQAKTLDDERRAFLDALRTLQSGNLYDEAFRIADETIGRLAYDRATLLYLTRLARAANRIELADRYARRLLELSLRLQWGLPLAADAEGGFMRVQFEARPKAKPPGSEGTVVVRRRFDDEVYGLAYDVFLANRKLADAYIVAASAVKQAPRNLNWRRRLARVCDWTGRPDEAFTHWLVLAQANNDAEAWNRIELLAPALNQLETMQAILERRLAQTPLDATLPARYVALLERRGQPEAAIAFLVKRLESQPAGPDRTALLQLLASVAERVGDEPRALSALRQLQQSEGRQPGLAIRIARLRYAHGDVEGAYSELLAADTSSGTVDRDYWRLRVELARHLGRREDAVEILLQLAAAEQADDADLFLLLELADEEPPARGARVAELMYARSPSPDAAMRVLAYHAAGGDWTAFRAFLVALPDATVQSLEQRPIFLRQRAVLRQRAGDSRRALADLQRASTLAPGDREARVALLWALVAQGDPKALRIEAQRATNDFGRSNELWPPLAVAWLQLGEPARALRYFRLQESLDPALREDPAWLLGYADALDQSGYAERAIVLRRRVWLASNVHAAEKFAADPGYAERVASLALTFAPGDSARRLIRAQPIDGPADSRVVRPPVRTGVEMVAAWRGLGETTESTPPPNETVGSVVRRAPDRLTDSQRNLLLAWARQTESDALARAWLAALYPDPRQRPAAESMTQALLEQDRDRAQQLLETRTDALPVALQIDAHQALRHRATAQTLATEEAARAPDDDLRHERLAGAMRDEVGGLSIGLLNTWQSPIRLDTWRAGIGLPMTQRFALSVFAARQQQTVIDTTTLANLPSSEELVGLRVRELTDWGQIVATASQRQSLENLFGVRLDATRDSDPRVSLRGTLGWNQIPTELALLRVAGTKDLAQGIVSWRPERRIEFLATLEANRLMSQARAPLADGLIGNGEARWRVRVEYPDLALRVGYTQARFNVTGQPDASLTGLLAPGVVASTSLFIPQSYRQVTLGAGFGEIFRDEPTRAWRPFADVSIFDNSVIGVGSGLRLGIAGSVLGNDHLTLFFSQVSGTPGSPQGLREAGLAWRWIF